MDTIKIGTFLAQLRKEQGLTQEQLGEELGVSNKTVSRWETGTYLPPVELLQLLSEKYDLTINEILCGERLTKEQYQERAEENIRQVLSESAFTAEDRVAFFKKKWKKEHLFEIFLQVLVCIAVFAAGNFIMEDDLLAMLSVFLLCGCYLYNHNQMMAYVERNAYRPQSGKN